MNSDKKNKKIDAKEHDNAIRIVPQGEIEIKIEAKDIKLIPKEQKKKQRTIKNK